MPTFIQKYIKCSDNNSDTSLKKIRTEYTDDMFGLGFESLEEIQQNYLNHYENQRLSERKVTNKNK